MPIIVIPDTGVNNVYINSDTGRNLILSGFFNPPPHNYLAGLQGGQSDQYYHLTAAEYSNLVTGEVIRPSDTGQFYPASNPSGFITGVDLSNYATIPYVTGISGSLQNQVSILQNNTGSYYLASNPSGFITGIDLTDYAKISFVTGVSGNLQSSINAINSQTGNFYTIDNPSGYITGVDLSNYATIPYVTDISGHLKTQMENFVPYAGATGNVDIGSFYFKGNIFEGQQFIGVGGQPALLSYGVIIGKGGTLESNPAITFQHGSDSAFLIAPSDLSSSQEWLLPHLNGTLITEESVDLSYYPRSNPSGFITGVDLSNYSTIGFSTGISGHLQTQIGVLNSNTGNYYPNSNPSGYITGNVLRPTDQVSFSTLIPTGIEQTGISFPYTFGSTPRVFAQLRLNSDTGYLVSVKNPATTGYVAVFSDIIEETGLYLQTFVNSL